MAQREATGHHSVGSRTRRFAGGLFGAAALLLASGLPVAAAPAPAAAIPPVEVAHETVPTMIVLDASGSMLADDAPGLRIDAAKNAVTALLDTLPTGAQVGLQVYGTATGSGDDEKAAGCQDVVTLAPVAPNDPAALKAAVAGIQARGYTPIGTALRSAAAALPLEGPRSIVLVSDGEDTCAPPAPCDVAKELELAGTDLVVHSVGFKVDQTARDQLACIAEATGGTYSDAGDAITLDQVLTTTVDEAIAGYTSAGIPVTGHDQQAPDAPLLGPGQYVDTYATGEIDSSPGTTKYYRVPTPVGGRVYVSATMVHPDTDYEGWPALYDRVALVDLDGDTCVSGNATGLPFTVDSDITVATLQLVADGKKDCTSREELHLRVERGGDAWANEPMTVEITVRIEPPAVDPGPAFVDESPDLPKPLYEASRPISGGRSFNDAVLLEPGRTYSDTVREGEARYYRVPVGWGQRLGYLLRDVGPLVGDVFVGNNIVVEAYNPVREEVDAARGAAMAFNDDLREIIGATPFPARYANRDEYAAGPLALDGEYYLVVIGSRHSGDEPPASTTVELTAVLSGDVEPGPVYGALGSVPVEPTGTPTTTSSGTTSSDTTAWETTESSTASPSPTTVTSSRVTTSDDAVTGTSATSQGGGATWWVVGAVVLAAVAGGAFVALRRRATAGH